MQIYLGANKCRVNCYVILPKYKDQNYHIVASICATHLRLLLLYICIFNIKMSIKNTFAFVLRSAGHQIFTNTHACIPN